VISFCLNKKKQKFKNKRSLTHKATHHRVCSILTRGFINLFFAKTGAADVHGKCEPQVSWQYGVGFVGKTKACGWFPWAPFLCLRTNSLIQPLAGCRLLEKQKKVKCLLIEK